MYHIAAGMMFICAIVVLKILPDIQTNFQGKYSGLMKSLLALVKRIPATAHLFDPGGTEFRFPPRHVVLSGF